MKLDPETAGSLKKLAEKVRNAADENARIEAIQDLQAALNALRPSGLSRKNSNYADHSAAIKSKNTSPEHPGQ